MKNGLFVSLLAFLIACDDNKSLTPYLQPEKEFKVEMSYDNFINSVSFLFVTDDSSSMNAEKKHLAENVSVVLEPLLRAYPYFNYNFAVTSMGLRKEYLKSFSIDLDLVQKKCSFNSSLIRKSPIGPYFNYKKGSFLGSLSNLVCMVSWNIEAERKATNIDENFFKPFEYIVNRIDFRVLSEFFGKDKILVLFFISDAAGDDYENRLRRHKKTPALITELMQKEFLDLLINRLNINEKNLRVYAVIPPEKKQDNCSLDPSAGGSEYKPPKHVFSLVEKMNGLKLSICDTNWGEYLKNISEHLLQSVPARTVYLEEIPQLKTIEVFFNGKKVPQNIETGWVLDIEKQTVSFGSDFDLAFYKRDSKANMKDEVMVKYKPMNLDILQNSE